MSYQRIAVAVALQRYREPPPVAREQLALARVYAQRSNASLHVVTAAAPVQLVRTGDEAIEGKLEHFALPLVNEGFEVHTACLSGRPADVLPDWLAEHEIDLLVLGTHSKRNPADVPIGNNAAALLADVDCAVMLIRPTRSQWDEAGKLIDPDYPWEFAYA
jgi:nucleotide-binding universal stress UspA family protein